MNVVVVFISKEIAPKKTDLFNNLQKAESTT